MFELFSEAVRSHYGVQCTCSAEKLVLAVRCLMVFIIIYVATTVVAAKFIRIIIASFTKMTVLCFASCLSLCTVNGRCL